MADSKISALAAITTPAATDEFVVASGGATKKIVPANLAKLMPNYEIAYVERTTNFSTTQTTEASADTILTFDSVTFDGATAVIIEFWTAGASISTTAQSGRISVWTDSTNSGWIGTYGYTNGAPLMCRWRLTPTAGAKVFTIRAHVSGASTFTIVAGSGGSGAFLPCYARIVRK